MASDDDADETAKEVPVVQAVQEVDAPAADRDSSNDDVFDRFVVCVVKFSWLVILITVGISVALGTWTLNVIYDQGVERTFALGDGGGSDRNDIRTLSFEGVRRAQSDNGHKWYGRHADEPASDENRTRTPDPGGMEAPVAKELLKRLPGKGWSIARADSMPDELFSEGFLPGQTPAVGPPTPEWEGLVAERVRQLNREGAGARSRRLQSVNEGVCKIFDWGSERHSLRTYESTVNDDVWGTVSDPWVPTISHEDHAQDIRYCYKEAFFSEIEDFDTQEQFVMRWRGNITIDVEGHYYFMTESDDGSYLYVDGQRVVENGGFHSHRTEVGEKYLLAGQHSVTITFFEAGGGAGLTAGMRAPDGEWQPISGQGFRFEAFGCGRTEAEATDSSELDFSVCDPFAAQQDKGATLGATGPGCNALCDPETWSCEATQTQEKDFFVLVFEAVSGDNKYYAGKDGDSYEYDKYDAGAGDLLTRENLLEMKRLEAALLENEEACIAKDEDDAAACAAADLSGGFAASMSACIGKEVTLDVSFDLSTLNSDSPTCKYNPGYRAFCRITEAADTTGVCGKIYGIMNFFFPRTPPPMVNQVIELGGAWLRDPENFALLLSTDLGCQIQWFTHLLFEGENSYGALFALLSAIVGQMSGMRPGETAETSSAETMASAIAFGSSSLADMYGNAMCRAPTEEACNGTPGCIWSSHGDPGCDTDPESTQLSQRFGELMCFGDGTGDELVGAALTQRAEDLAVFFSKVHIKPYLSFFFDKGFSEDNPHLKYTRGFMQFGGPMEGFEARSYFGEEEYKVQEDALVDWFQWQIRPEFQKNEESDEPNTDPERGATGGQVEITYLLGSLLGSEVVALLVGDVLLAELSFLIVGFYMWFQTGSLWISMFGMAEITISLPLGYWVYSYIFAIEYFDPICMLVLYVVMAIGADDVFIWFDAYKQSGYEAPEISGSLETRFIWAWRKAASAMLVTSLTTCAVFFATATSPLLNIKSFGIYAAIVIFLDYIYVITWLPAATVLYNKWFENTGLCKCACFCKGPREDFTCGPLPPKVGAVLIGMASAFPTAVMWSSYFWWLGGQDEIYAQAYIIGFLTFSVLMVGITTRVALTAYRTDEGRNAADFFHGQATDVIVNNDKVRKGLLIGAIVIFVPMAICAFFVEPSNKSEEYLPSDHPLQKIVTIMSNEFPPAQWDRMVKAEIVFGINPAMPLDRKGKNDLMDYERPPDYHNQESWQEHMEAAKLPENWPHQPETCCGVPCSTLPCSQTTPPTCEQPETCYVDSFDWANPETQSYMLQVCNEVDSSSFVTHDRDPSCTQDPCSVVRTTCVVKEMIEWLGRNCSDPDTLSAEGDDCISAASVDLLASYGLERVPDVSCFSMSVAEEDRCLLPQDKANRILFDFYEVSKLQQQYGLIGFTDYSDRDARVLYMTIRFPVQLKEGSFYTVSELSIPFDAIDEYVNSLNVPASAGGVLPTHRTTSGYWVFMHTQSIYITYAVLGILCAIGLAYVVLVVATNNLIVASAAVLTIFAVVACVLGIMVLVGWQLGMTESVCLTILAGFCVDYIVHFAHSFKECPDRSSRQARAAYAMGHMGISVLSGALTSLGASSLLLFCTLQFFFTFGAFFFGTIMLAWLWANFFFIPLLAEVGPEGTTADVFGAGGLFGGGGGGVSADASVATANPLGEPDEDDQGED